MAVNDLHLYTRTLYISTTEKAHVIVTSLYESSRFSELGLIVVDELHMVGDGTSRGATLETLMVKIKLSAAQEKSKLRLLGMSATLSNLADLGDFLNARIIQNDFRPVALKEYVKLNDKLLEVDGSSNLDQLRIVRTVATNSKPGDSQGLSKLVGEVMERGDSCLVFCPTKAFCENVALALAERYLPKHFADQKAEERKNLYHALKYCGDGSICGIMARAVRFGVAYHHSGLTGDERELIENAFLNGTLLCIVATSTLAAGVNLPAQRVIIRSPYVGNNFISKAQYKQMCGRAGRAGFGNSHGESILIIDKPTDRYRAQQMFNTPLAGCVSSLGVSHNSIATFLLNLVYLNLANDFATFKRVIEEETLYGIQNKAKINVTETIQMSVDLLLKHKLLHEFNEEYRITDLGRAAVKGLIAVEKSQVICDSLEQNAKGRLNRPIDSVSLYVTFLLTIALCVADYFHLFYISTLLNDLEDIPFRPGSLLAHLSLTNALLHSKIKSSCITSTII